MHIYDSYNMRIILKFLICFYMIFYKIWLNCLLIIFWCDSCLNNFQSVVPGTDAAYLAMDIEDGVEVIWNEVTFAEKKDFISKEKQMMENLNSLISIAHPNIVKVSAFHQNTSIWSLQKIIEKFQFHNYWIDRNRPKIRVVFITEYTGGSGTLKDFLRRTKYIQPAQVKK